MNTGLNKILRFETLTMIVIAAIMIFIVQVEIPYAGKLARQGSGLYGFWALKERTAAAIKEKKDIQHEVRQLDSLIKIYESRVKADEGAAAAMLYERADTAKIKNTKVTIGEKVAEKEYDETSVTVRGSGSYTAIGQFTAALENLPTPVRVRQVTATAAKGGEIDAIIDFVLLTQQTNKGR